MPPPTRGHPPKELAITKNFLRQARAAYTRGFYRATMLYSMLAIESFWWRVRFGKEDVLVSYVTSKGAKNWIKKAENEGLLSTEDRVIISHLYSIRDANVHFNPHMEGVKRYTSALKQFDLDPSALVSSNQLTGSKPVAKVMLAKTEVLLDRWLPLVA